jgi:hypothetical protein
LKCFGFNLKNKHQCEAVDQLIQDASIFTINGWKVARQIPKWVNGFDAFLQFMEDNWNLADKYEYDFEKDINDDDKNNVEDEVDENGEDDMEDVQEEDDVRRMRTCLKKKKKVMKMERMVQMMMRKRMRRKRNLALY